MKRLLALALAFAAVAPMSALANDRMTDVRYLQAARCVAYADLAQLQGDGYRVETLRQEVDAQGRLRISAVRQQAADAARDIRLAARRAGDDADAAANLRESRDAACGRFVPTGQVQIDAAAAPS